MSKKEQPVFTVKGADIPRRDIFKNLKHIYLTRTEESNSELAKILDITPQSCSTMATGTDRRSPPWWVIMRLCSLLDYEIVLTPDDVRLRIQESLDAK